MASRPTDVPVWQADEEAAECCICDKKFSLFFRRHHCRKCGRIVCAACSSHKTTYLPATYVVSPPTQIFLESPHVPHRTCDECLEELEMIRGALGIQAPSQGYIGQGAPDGQGHRARFGGSDGSHQSYRRSSEGSGTVAGSGTGRELARSIGVGPGYGTNMSVSLTSNPGTGMSLFRDRRGRRRISRSNRSHGTSTGAGSGTGTGEGSSVGTSVSKSFQEHMIQVAEASNGGDADDDDNSLCPVCGTGLVKFAKEKDKEHHIAQCLDRAQFGKSKNSQPNRMLIYRIPERTATPNTSTSPDTAETTSPSTPPSSTPAPTAAVAPGIGGTTECVICFEEFQPGDRVGRLECLCVYHEQCILGWFQRKGMGSCPVHAVQQ